MCFFAFRESGHLLPKSFFPLRASRLKHQTTASFLSSSSTRYCGIRVGVWRIAKSQKSEWPEAIQACTRRAQKTTPVRVVTMSHHTLKRLLSSSVGRFASTALSILINNNQHTPLRANCRRLQLSRWKLLLKLSSLFEVSWQQLPTLCAWCARARRVIIRRIKSAQSGGRNQISAPSTPSPSALSLVQFQCRAAIWPNAYTVLARTSEEAPHSQKESCVLVCFHYGLKSLLSAAHTHGGLTFCCFRPLAPHTRVLEEDALLQNPLLYIVPLSLSLYSHPKQFQSAHASLMHFSKAAALSASEVPLEFFCAPIDFSVDAFHLNHAGDQKYAFTSRLDDFVFNIHHDIGKL